MNFTNLKVSAIGLIRLCRFWYMEVIGTLIIKALLAAALIISSDSISKRRLLSSMFSKSELLIRRKPFWVSGIFWPQMPDKTQDINLLVSFRIRGIPAGEFIRLPIIISAWGLVFSKLKKFGISL